MKSIKVVSHNRNKAGKKGELSDIRKENVPAVIYGANKEPVSISISMKDLSNIIKVGSNSMLDIDIDGKVEKAIVKDIQYHAVKDVPIHVDFLRISLKEKITVSVPVHLIGECEDVKKFGALVDHSIREIEVKCLPNDIPHEFNADISKMTLQKPIMVSDLNIGENIEVLSDDSKSIVHLIIPRAAAVEEEKTEESKEAEPEVITKGKKDEDGEGSKEEGGSKDSGTDSKEPKKNK